MNESLVAVIVLCVILLALPVALLLLRDRLARPSQAEIAEHSREFARRLRNPDLAAVARHFNCPLPESVQSLYADAQELARSDFMVAASLSAPHEGRWYLAYYLPADGQSLQDACPGLQSYFAFADDGSGNQYLVDPTHADPAVMFHDHETGELQRVCAHFTEFMQWPRLEVPS